MEGFEEFDLVNDTAISDGIQAAIRVFSENSANGFGKSLEPLLGVPSAADLDAVETERETAQATVGALDFDAQDAVNNVRQTLQLLVYIVSDLQKEFFDLKARIAKYNLGAPHKI